MRVTVTDETGERFSYDTAKESLCLHPSRAEVPAVVDALREAARFLGAGPAKLAPQNSEAG